MTNRRAFLKQSCATCAGLLGLGAVATQLSSCAAHQILKINQREGVVSIPISNFSQTQNIVIVRSEQLEFDIAVVLIDEVFKAFELQCTHQANHLIAGKNGFFCNAHGSRFDFNGKSLSPPAVKSLKSFEVSKLDQFVVLKLV